MEILQPIFECPVCLERLKDPKVLGCFHSMCNLCVQQYVVTNAYDGEMPCPTCRQVTAIPAPGGASGAAKLPVNSYLASLIDVASKVLTTSITDSPSLRGNEAVQSPRDGGTADTPAKCRRHSSEAVQLYCASCACPICVQCVLTSCKQHEHKSVASAAGEARGALTRLASTAGAFMGNAARAGTDARAYRVEMLEQKAAFLRSLEQRKLDVDAALRSAHDAAVKRVEQRTTAWDAAATDFTQRVNESQSLCQRLLIELGDLISHRSDLTVISNFSDAEMRLNELLTSVRLQETSLARQKFSLLAGGNDPVASIKKLFQVSVTNDKETTLKLLSKPEATSMAAEAARNSSTVAIAGSAVGKDSAAYQAGSPIVANASSTARYVAACQPIVYPGLGTSTYQQPQGAAAAVVPPIVYPGMMKQSAPTYPYGAESREAAQQQQQGPPMLSAVQSGTAMPAYPAVTVLSYPSPPASAVGITPSSSLLPVTAANITVPLLRAASALFTGAAALTSGSTPAAAAAAAAAAMTGAAIRVKTPASPQPIDLGSLKQSPTAKFNKKTVKKWVKRALAAIGQTEESAQGTGTAAVVDTAAAAEIGAEVAKYLLEAQCDSGVLVAVFELLLAKACERPEAARALACVAKQLAERLPSVAITGESGKSTNFKKVLQDRYKLELDLKSVGSVPAQLVIAKVQFVACLFDEELLNEWTMHDGIIRCLKEEAMEDCLEYGCGLLLHYLHRLDTPSAVPRINQHLKQINRLKTLPDLSPQIKAALQDVLNQVATEHKGTRLHPGKMRGV